MLLDARDTWLERTQIQSLRSSPCFSILADECQDIFTQEELSICCRWIVDGYPEEHFVDILHVKDVDAASITQALTTFIEVNNLDYRRLVGQGYDGAATFSGCTNGVQRRIRTQSAHVVYIHCACHRLQLASIQAAEPITVINKMFGTMTSLWKLFYYSPKKAEALKVVQSVLNLPELKVVKPSSTRWLSHERCLSAIRKDLPALIITLQQL
ncbi:Zinc finger protein [Oopsacas minuta]|uniref:Zinc finger protein n=1 Tax=Oopsacas minuta TaxID=111878 RepID=A0AAV7KA09_9METZ|nr:Zinc finger protein [Oopsacas minuta]